MPNQEWLHQKTAVVLDTRVLAKRCLDLDREIQDWRQRCGALEEEINRIQQQYQWQERLVEFAQTEIKKIKQQIQANIRAVEHHTGTQDRLRYLQKCSNDEHTSPLELLRVHQSLEEEVRYLYPAEPQSKRTTGAHQHRLQSNRMTSFRFVESTNPS